MCGNVQSPATDPRCVYSIYVTHSWYVPRVLCALYIGCANNSLTGAGFTTNICKSIESEVEMAVDFTSAPDLLQSGILSGFG